MTTAAGIVSSDHLSKWYGQVIGLNDVSVVVPSGITGLDSTRGIAVALVISVLYACQQRGEFSPKKRGMVVFEIISYCDSRNSQSSLMISINFCVSWR